MISRVRAQYFSFSICPAVEGYFSLPKQLNLVFQLLGLFVNAATADKVILKIVEIKPDVSHSFYFSSESASNDRDEFKAGISSILSLRQQRAMNGGATPSYSGAAPSPGGGGGSPVISDASAPGTPKAQAKLVGMKRGLNGGGPPQELKTRFALLKQNKELAGLHRDLVMGKHVSEEEFWESRKHLLRNKIAMDGQQKGQSSAWLDLKPETGESNDVKYVMTPQVIHSVCQQYPSSNVCDLRCCSNGDRYDQKD